MLHHHDTTLVLFSYLTSVAGSFVALLLANLACRLREGAQIAVVSFAAAVALGGVGIWTMHFIAMLGWQVDMPVGYSILPTVNSAVVAVLVVWAGLLAVRSRSVGLFRLVAAGVMVGLGVAGMHYMGMSAIQMQAVISYDPTLLAASIGVAIAAATVALWLVTRLNRVWQMFAAALVMGIAVCGMHYVGMLATMVTPDASLAAVVNTWVLTDDLLAFLILPVAVATLVFAGLVYAIYIDYDPEYDDMMIGSIA